MIRNGVSRAQGSPSVPRWAGLILAWSVLWTFLPAPVSAQPLPVAGEGGFVLLDAKASVGSLPPALRMHVPQTGKPLWLPDGSTEGALAEPWGAPAVSDWIGSGQQNATASSRWWGAAIGGVIGAAATYVVLNSGVDSTQRCNQAANQDAIETRYCVGLYVLGGLAGAGVGWMVGKWFTDDP